MRRIMSVLMVAGLLAGVTASSVAAATSTTVTWNVSGQTTAAVSAKSLLSELTVTQQNGYRLQTPIDVPMWQRGRL